MKARMYKYIFSFILVCFSFICKGQTIDGKLYTPFNNYYQWLGGKFNNNLNIPKIAATTGRDTGGIRYNLTDSSMYIWTGSQWRAVGSSFDSTSLSNRINQRVKYSDTASMLSPYLRKLDTASLSNRINLKQNLITLSTTGTTGAATFNQSTGALNIPNYSTDTTSLSNRINLKLNISDTANMLNPYLRKVDTLSLSNRINLKVNISDTSNMLNPYLRKIDTTNAFLISVSQPNDSTLRFAKGSTQTDYIIRASSAGSATRLTTTVYNNTGSLISKGAVVYINGRHSSNLPTIALAQANTEANSYTTFALVETDIANGSSGIVIQAGNIGNLNLPTSTYSDGQVLYLSPTVAGGYTTTKPLAPNHIVKLGTITRAHPTLGSIQIKIENGWQLDELSDVQIAAVPNDSTILQFSRVDSLWKAVDPTTAMGNRFVKRTDTAAMLAPYQRALLPYRAISTTYNALTTDYVIHCTSGTFTINLPTAVGIQGEVFIIKNSGSGFITIDPNGSQTIDGSTTYTMSQAETVQIISTGANWITL